MKTRLRWWLPLLLLGAAFWAGCENDKVGSLWEAGIITTRPDPTITSIEPVGGALAAVDTLTITGTNFSTIPSENTVYCDTREATVLSATATQLKVISPTVFGDAIKIKVAVFRAELFSNTITYKLEQAVTPLSGFTDVEGAAAMTTDAAGNLYISITTNGADQGIVKVTPRGERSNYAARTAGVAQWTSLKFGPQGYLYAARNVRAIYRFPPGGAGGVALWVAFPLGVSINDMDYDQSKNLWAGGNNQAVYMIRPDATSKSFPFVANIRSVRVFNGYLYMAGRQGTIEGVWRAQILPDSLSTPELYFNLSASPSTSNNSALSITFSSDGYMYVGTESPKGVLVVTPARSAGAPYGAYSNAFGSGGYWLAWGMGEGLYLASGVKPAAKILTRKASAPYFGN